MAQLQTTNCPECNFPSPAGEVHPICQSRKDRGLLPLGTVGIGCICCGGEFQLIEKVSVHGQVFKVCSHHVNK